MFAAAFDFGSYANFRAFAQKQGRAGHFCQSETDWDLSLSLRNMVCCTFRPHRAMCPAPFDRNANENISQESNLEQAATCAASNEKKM